MPLISNTTDSYIIGYTLQSSGVTISVVSMNTVPYVSMQPSNKILLIFGEDNFTNLQ